jgi:hypothetical protein
MKRKWTMMTASSATVLLGTVWLWAQNAHDQTADVPGLPRVLLIGDSIRGGYMEPARNLLKGKANVRWPSANCGGTSQGISNIDEWLGDGDWDVIHFNWGLWDINRRVNGKRDNSGPIALSQEQYEENLEILVNRMKETKATLIWASTTFVQGGWGRRVGDEIRYNQIAEEVMDRRGVLINDLHGLSATFPMYGEAKEGEPEMFKSKGNVHFSKEGYQRLAEQVAQAIEKTLVGEPL